MGRDPFKFFPDTLMKSFWTRIAHQQQLGIGHVCTLLFKFLKILSCLFLFELWSKYASADNLVSSLFLLSSAYHWHNPCHLTPHDPSVSLTTHPVCAASFSCFPEQNEDGAQNACTPPGKRRGLVQRLCAVTPHSTLLASPLSCRITNTCSYLPRIQNWFCLIWKLWKRFHYLRILIQADCFSVCTFKVQRLMSLSAELFTYSQNQGTDFCN